MIIKKIELFLRTAAIKKTKKYYEIPDSLSVIDEHKKNRTLLVVPSFSGET